MGYSNISASITAEVKTAIKTSVDSTTASLPFLVKLTPEERKKLRKIGPNRVGYAGDVNRAANTHPGVLPASFKLEEYNNDMALLEDLKDIHSWVTPLFEAVESTLIALGNEVMKQSDEVYGYLKVATKKSQDQNLNMTIKKIADQLKQTKDDDNDVKP